MHASYYTLYTHTICEWSFFFIQSLTSTLLISGSCVKFTMAYITLVMLLVCLLHGAIGQVYIITPSELDMNCTDQPCFITLSQFAGISNHHTDANITLIIRPGNHSLAENLTISNINGILMRSESNAAVVACEEDSHFTFINVSGYVHITDLKFIGCKGNRVEYVSEFLLTDTIIEGRVDSTTSTTALEIIDTTTQILNCTFISNKGGKYRETVKFIETANSSPDCPFSYNSDSRLIGGAIIGSHSNITISQSNFAYNSAQLGGAIFAEINSEMSIVNCTFISNDCGPACPHFIRSGAATGGAVFAEESTITLTENRFLYSAAVAGGAVGLFNSTATIHRCLFDSNTALLGGALYSHSSSIMVYESQFNNNSVGAAIGAGGVMYSFRSNVTLDGKFYGNRAPQGAVAYAQDSFVGSQNDSILKFTNNSAVEFAILHLVQSTGHFDGNVTFSNNLGTLVAYRSSVTFEAIITFMDCLGPQTTVGNIEEGGAITAFQSNIFFNGVCRLHRNRADNGGALHATESKLIVNGLILLENNTAAMNGGGIFLYQSEMNCQPESTLILSGNNASEQGGGVHAISSTIDIVARSHVIEGATVEFSKNTAKRGGGLSLEANAKFNVIKTDTYQDVNSTINFALNVARYGAAVYVEDSTYSSMCASSSRSECFFQVLAIHSYQIASVSHDISFAQNYASISGSTLFGGLLDRCTASPFAEVHNIQGVHYDKAGIDYIHDVSSFSELSSISSKPVQVCLCINEYPQCSSNQLHSIQVMKGESFSVSLVAVDQDGHPVNAIIQSSLSFFESGLAEGQLTRRINKNCTDLTFNVVSPHDSEELTLFASDGPCQNAELSRRSIKIEFLSCTCPLGFQPSHLKDTSCTCECHSRFSERGVTCDTMTNSLMKQAAVSNLWFSYINDSELSGYLIFPNCPYGYCKTGNVIVNLNEPNGADAQCTFGRSGVLCGACQKNFSLSLGSSRCLSCPDHWPALFVSISIAFILAGLALVAVILLLNMTVATGTINGLIFYANIVFVNRSVLLPFSESNFVTVLISWLNLEVGIDFCYFPGIDMYAKVWLELAFPLYVFFLVALIIIVSSFSSRFSDLIGKKNPVATLATLILLSFTKLHKFIFTVLLFGTLEYPDGSLVVLWLPDATVKYLSGKYIALFIVVLFVFIFCLVYTALLFSWQWLLRLPEWKIFKVVRNQKMHAFMDSYHAPYTPKHRYWTGLLLLVRVTLLLVVQIDSSNNPQITLSAIIFIMSCILSLKAVLGSRVYKSWPVDMLEILFHFNIISFATFTFVVDSNHHATAYTSVSITFFLLLMIIFYHVYAYTNVFSKVRDSKIGLKLDSLCSHHEKDQISKSRGADDAFHSNEFLEIMDHSNCAVLDNHAVTHSSVKVPTRYLPHAAASNSITAS